MDASTDDGAGRRAADDRKLPWEPPKLTTLGDLETHTLAQVTGIPTDGLMGNLIATSDTIS
jgi:hypothetical protein